MVDAGGMRWHVQGGGKGPTMLLVHGTGASTHSWRDLLPMLAREYCVLAIDLPGHGFSDAASAAGSSIAGMSGALTSLLRELQVSPQYCVGHSAGAVILCRMALDGNIAPRMIVSINGAFLPFAGAARLVFPSMARLLAAAPFVPGLIARRAGSRANVARLIAGTGSRLDAAGVELYAQLLSSPQHLAGALRMMGNWDLHAFAGELPRLTTPLTLLVGENDLTVPAHQALEVRQRGVKADIRYLSGMGHLAHEEQPAMIAQEILKICRPC